MLHERDQIVLNSAQMSTKSRAQRERARQMLEIARRHYIDDESMVSIGQRLGISRFKVARMLQEARESGLVTITLHSGGEEDEALSDRLAKHLALPRASAVEAFGSTEDIRRIVGVRAGQILGGTLQNGETLGLAWGRTLTHMIESLERLPNVQILQLNGAVGSNLSQSPIELVRRAALIGGNNAKAIMAPLYINSIEAARAMRNQPDIKEVLELFDTVTTAVVAVGSFAAARDGGINSQFLPLLPDGVQQQLLDSGAIAEACGIPFRPDGSVADRGLLEHILAITPEQLGRIPRVIGVASDPTKASAIHALCHAGMITELVVDADLAEALLALPALSAAERRR